jgi:hypothetical protein
MLFSRLLAVALALRYAVAFMAEAAGGHNVANMSIDGIIILGASGFVYSSIARRRATHLLFFATGVLLAAAFLTLALRGLGALVATLSYALALNFGDAINSGVRAYLFTLPAAAGAYLLVGSPPITVREIFLPYVALGRIATDELRERQLGQAILNGARTLVKAAALLIILVFVAEVPLPFDNKTDNDNARVALLFGLLCVAYLVDASLTRLRRHLWQRSIRSQLAGRAISAESVRIWLLEARTQEVTLNLLKVLRNAAPRAALPSVFTLTDLARALEHVDRIVPAETKKLIPRGVWDVGPEFSQPDFVDWISAYDRRYPGRLTWMADSCRDMVAQALDRARSED